MNFFVKMGPFLGASVHGLVRTNIGIDKHFHRSPGARCMIKKVIVAIPSKTGTA
jgi:hypothetical protein